MVSVPGSCGLPRRLVVNWELIRASRQRAHVHLDEALTRGDKSDPHLFQVKGRGSRSGATSYEGVGNLQTQMALSATAPV